MFKPGIYFIGVSNILVGIRWMKDAIKITMEANDMESF